MAKVGINGFGRTGKLLLRTMLERQPVKIIPCAINDPEIDSPKYAAYLFKHDSVQGRFYGNVCCDDKHLIVNGNKIALFKETDCKKISWSQAGVEYVAECSGKYSKMDQAKQLLTGKVKRVVISATSPDAPMYILGVNHKQYKPANKIVSMASCTTNCITPLIKVVHQNFGIREGFISTIHAITSDQKLLDGPSQKDWRSGRAAFLNIIPQSSQTAIAVGKILPELAGKITGMAFRVPLPTVSMADFTVRICKSAKLDDINESMKDASKCSLDGILCYTDEMVVSADFKGCSCSCIYDASASMQLNEHFFKLVTWYDNEYGYASRLADFLAFIYEKDCEAECKKDKKT